MKAPDGEQCSARALWQKSTKTHSFIALRDALSVSRADHKEALMTCLKDNKTLLVACQIFTRQKPTRGGGDASLEPLQLFWTEAGSLKGQKQF